MTQTICNPIMNIDGTSVSFELRNCGAPVNSEKLIKGEILKVEPLRIWPQEIAASLFRPCDQNRKGMRRHPK